MAGDEGGRQLERSSSVAVPITLLFPLVMALGGGILVAAVGTSLPVPGFYQLAAQVIPLLMIAFALEGRATEFLSDPQMRVYRAQLFVFLLVGEIFALLGASGTLRGGAHPFRSFGHGWVAGTFGWSNFIAAVTAAGLIGGFSMLAVLALFWGPGWVSVSLGRSERSRGKEVQELREKLRDLEQRLDDPS